MTTPTKPGRDGSLPLRGFAPNPLPTPAEPMFAPLETMLSAGDTARLVRGIPGEAGRLTALLDRIHAGYGRRGCQEPDPVRVALEQAAAAAHDLRSSIHTALAILAAQEETSPEDPSRF